MHDPNAGQRQFRLRFLGAYEISCSGGVVHFETAKTRALFAYLALSSGPQPREKLAGLFWGGLPQARAQRNLRHSLWNLLSRLSLAGCSPILLSDKQTIEFNRQASYWLDVEEFESRLAMSRSGPTSSRVALPRDRHASATISRQSLPGVPHVIWQQAMDLYRGDLLEGIYVDDAPEFSEWLMVERARLKAIALQTLQRLVAYYTVSGDYDPGLDSARRLLAMDPWVEEAHRQMIRLLALNGQRSAALEQYETCRRILKQELGVEPSAETTVLYQRLSESPALPVDMSLGKIPIPITRLIGRAADEESVKSLLARGRLVTLTGAGGCGKTRLAMQVAMSLMDAFREGVLWIDVAPLDDPDLIAQSIAQALGIIASPNHPLSETLPSHLRDRNMLLVLDNCEHLVNACSALTFAILRACQHVQVLATSRQPLGIVGEVTWRVPSLAFPAPGPRPTLQDLSCFSSCELFVERARAVRTDFALTEENAAHVAQVCRRLDGIPLAVELAAARVKVLPVKEIAERLDDRFNLLTAAYDSVLPRHQTLSRTMDWSYDLLSEPERALFRQLAVFVGGWTLRAAEKVTGAAELGGPSTRGPNESHSVPSVLNLLARLIDKSLVTTLEKGEQSRYQFPETIREYARQRLFESGETERIRNHHLAFFLRLSEEGAPRLHDAEQVSWLNRLEMEHDNLRAALGWALECGNADAGLRLASALGEFWERHGYLTEGSEWFARTLLKFSSGPAAIHAKAVVHAAKLEWTHGSYERALVLAGKSLGLCRELGDEEGIAFSLYTLGGVNHYAGDHDRAIELLEESLRLFQQLQNVWGTAATLLWLACAWMKKGDTEGAAPLWEQSLSLFTDVGDQWGIAFALGGLGDVSRLRGDYARARALLRKSMILHWQLGNKSSITFTLESLAVAAQAEGQTARAARLWGAADALHDSIGSPVPPSYHAEYAPYLAGVRGQPRETALQEAYAEGRSMTLEQMIEYG